MTSGPCFAYEETERNYHKAKEAHNFSAYEQREVNFPAYSGVYKNCHHSRAVQALFRFITVQTLLNPCNVLYQQNFKSEISLIPLEKLQPEAFF